MTRASSSVKACAVVAQPGHTKDSELQSVQLERGLRIVDLPGVIFEDDDSIRGQKMSSVLLHNVVKPEDVDDPISVVGVHPVPALLRDLISVEEILARTQTERLMKIYDLPTFSSTLEFLTMLALSIGRLLKVVSPLLSSETQKNHFFPVGWHRRYPLCGASCPHRREPPKNTVILRAARAARRAYTLDNPR
jgi:nuclear GTP-binding protein